MKEDTTPIDPTWMEKTGGYARDMTLRDYYAGLALQGLLAHKNAHGATWDEIVGYAHVMADNMLEGKNAT